MATEKTQEIERDYAIGVGVSKDGKIISKSSTILVNGEGSRTTVFYDPTTGKAEKVSSEQVDINGKVTKFGPQSLLHEDGSVAYQEIIYSKGRKEVPKKTITNVLSEAEARFKKVNSILTKASRGRDPKLSGGNGR